MLTIRIRNWSWFELILYFLTYSFLGWFLEISSTFIENGHYTSRGFIFGPFCIIYGFGALLVLTVLHKSINKPFIYFFSSLVLITLLEYFTGFILEAVFHRRWWDYSYLYLNLNGYVSLRNSILWGLLALLIFKYVHPHIEAFFRKLSPKKAATLALLVFIFFVINILFSIFHNI